MSYADLDIGFGRKEDVMDRRDILAERPVESGRGFMPGVSVNPSRVLFTAGLTGRGPDGNLVAGGMGPQARRTFERLQAVLSRADARFDNVIKQLAYVTDLEAYNPDGSVAGIGDWRRQAEKVYENIGHVLRAAGATSASAVKETTWVLSIDSWRQGGAPVRRDFYKGDFPASTLVEIPGLARPEFLVEIEVIAAIA